MNKADYSKTIDELILCATEVISSAEAVKISGEKAVAALKAARAVISDTGSADDPVTKEKPVPTRKQRKPEFSFAEVRKAFTAKSHDGFAAQTKELIAGYGASKLSDIKPENYAAIMAELEELK